MCYDCNCDSPELCSIMQIQPINFCCIKCELYDEMKTCFKANIAIQSEEKHLLPHSFCMKHKMLYTELLH